MPKKLGDAFVQVRPDTSTFQSESRSRIGGALSKVIKGVGVTAGAVLGVSLAKGFQRLSAIDQATAKLQGLGHSGVEVSKIMKNALASVKGTAFGLDEAAGVSAAAVAAGIKPGRELTKTLKLVADAATIGGTSMGDMGAIFNKVAASNKLQGDVIAQLGDKGIPIVSMLGKTLGKTSEEVVALASKGKINFAQFQSAMQSGLGGAAKGSAVTFTGAWKNMMASVSRSGAGLLGGAGGKGGIFGQLAPSIRGITDAMAPLETKSGQLGSTIGRALVPLFEKLPGLVTKAVNGLSSLDVGGLMTKISAGSGKIGPALKDLGTAVASIDFSKLGGAAAQGAADTISVFSVVVGAAAKHTDLLAKVLPALVVGYAAVKTATAAANIASVAHIPVTIANAVANTTLARSNRALAAAMVASTATENASTVARSRGVIATIASTVASKAAAAASKVWAAGQWLLNAALTANPIGLIVVAIAALVGGLILAYKKSETFRNIVNGAFAGVQAVISKVLPVIAAVIRTYFNVYKTIFITAFRVIRAVVQGAMAVVGAVIRRGVAIARGAFASIAGVVGIVRRVFGAVHAAVVGRINAVIAAVRTVNGRIKGIFSGAAGMLRGIGRNIIDGLVNGIRGAASAVAGAVRNIVDKIPKAVRKIMGIASPSKVMAALARWIPAGMAVGIDAGSPAVERAMGRLSSKMTAQVAASVAIPTIDVPRGRVRARDLDARSGGARSAAADLAALLDGLGLELVVDGEKFGAYIRAKADGSVEDARDRDDTLARLG